MLWSFASWGPHKKQNEAPRNTSMHFTEPRDTGGLQTRERESRIRFFESLSVSSFLACFFLVGVFADSGFLVGSV